jgi:FdhD protein
MEPSDASRFSVSIERWSQSSRISTEDSVVEEEPLEIRVNDVPLAVTMRTPGDDEALAVGFLASEGILRSTDDLFDITRCAEPEYPDLFNIVTAYVAPERLAADIESGRHRYATSSCGLCGRASIDAVREIAVANVVPISIEAHVIYSLPDAMREAQHLFSRTGGLHAAALFDRRGKLQVIAEDIGRHNAVDKVLGRSLLEGDWPPAERILLVSGRAGFEIVQKACVTGVPIVCSVSAPSSLAIQLARETGVTLIGFLRGTSMNVYTGAQWITP